MISYIYITAIACRSWSVYTISGYSVCKILLLYAANLHYISSTTESVMRSQSNTAIHMFIVHIGFSPILPHTHLYPVSALQMPTVLLPRWKGSRVSSTVREYLREICDIRAPNDWEITCNALHRPHPSACDDSAHYTCTCGCDKH